MEFICGTARTQRQASECRDSPPLMPLAEESRDRPWTGAVSSRGTGVAAVTACPPVLTLTRRAYRCRARRPRTQRRTMGSRTTSIGLAVRGPTVVGQVETGSHTITARRRRSCRAILAVPPASQRLAGGAIGWNRRCGFGAVLRNLVPLVPIIGLDGDLRSDVGSSCVTRGRAGTCVGDLSGCSAGRWG